VISDIVAIGGLCTTALSVVAIVALAYKLIEAVASERAAMSAETLAEKAQQGAEFARDAALAAQKKAEAERGDALAKLEATEKRLNAALGKEADEGAAKVAAEPTAGAALADVNAELQLPLVPGPGAGPAAAAAGADHGHAGQDAVQPAPAADAGDDGRSSRR
jgi:hypothetical protein